MQTVLNELYFLPLIPVKYMEGKLVYLSKSEFIQTRRAFLKRPENFSGPETAPQSSRNDFRVFLKAPENF